jgi:hypothetical protein
MRCTLRTTVIAILSAGVVVAAAEFKSTWKAPDAGTLGFAGKKVAALVITTDEALRMSAEEALVRQLVPLGLQAQASYRMIPGEAMKDKEAARAWFDKIGVEGVVAMRPVSSDTVRSYSPSMWSVGYYTSLWNYYGYAWGVAWSPGPTVREDTLVTVETLVFSVPRNKLLWAALSETTNPKSMDAFMKDLVGKAVKELKKEGLAAKPRK